MDAAKRLRALHRDRAPGDPLVLPGPWDAASARAFAEAGFPALATPSAGVSASLGHADGQCPGEEMFAAIGRVTRAVRALDVPVTADVERGYGLAPAELAERLHAAGAVGCNLEDSAGGHLVDAEAQADFLAAVREALGPEPFLNARVDAHLRGVADPLAEALRRGRAYVAAGADGVYPIGAPPADLAVLVRELGVPVNGLARTGGPGVAELAGAGVGRVTFGGGLAARATEGVRAMAAELRAGRPL
ncbi:isocitrate lyase/phosphoenolpyruvate mutase family protein [Streptomyces tubbatahanensis]|uniref:Isocitrate lyase/phosphoenolpyruvate mutase family protein n=1 Tax=Streptomyces tubbatahanensis TaxID=2923272 RepID=A0ABY3XW41_9ACTN|nr:isocitrate lyase/phosphoenolpyruvate mutase family protein [Streptomyces tubbatahanensis]UNS98555.1 isocitrate lyase/phosphoenolpyruvate mutase family protein [Streptomyces tubbatahanensis]